MQWLLAKLSFFIGVLFLVCSLVLFGASIYFGPGLFLMVAPAALVLGLALCYAHGSLLPAERKKRLYAKAHGWRSLGFLAFPLGVVGVVSIAGTFFAIYEDAPGWVVMLLGVVGLACAFAMFNLERHEELGWTLDEDGGIHKVHGEDSQAEKIIKQAFYDQRSREEALIKEERRREIFKFAIVGLLPLAFGLVGIFIFSDTTTSGSTNFICLLCIVIGFLGTCVWCQQMFFELLYQSGYQDMKGAKVLGARPIPTGIKEVEEQKVHGDARLATQTEIAIAATGRTKSSSLHDKRF